MADPRSELEDLRRLDELETRASGASGPAGQYDQSYATRAAAKPVPQQKDYVYSTDKELRAANVDLAKQQAARATDAKSRSGYEQFAKDIAVPRPPTPASPKPAGPPEPWIDSPPQRHWWEQAVPREPGYEYGSILPFRKPIGGGPAQWAIPELGKAAIDLFTGGGRALRGEDIQPQETLSDAMFMLGRAPGRIPARIPEPTFKRVEPTMRGPTPDVGPQRQFEGQLPADVPEMARAPIDLGQEVGPQQPFSPIRMDMEVGPEHPFGPIPAPKPRVGPAEAQRMGVIQKGPNEYEAPPAEVQAKVEPKPPVEVPYTVYHGTRSEFAEFDVTKSKDGLIHLSTDPKEAKTFGATAQPQTGKARVMELNLSMSNPFNVDSASQADAASWTQAKANGKAAGWLKDRGYDGATEMNGRHIMVADQAQIGPKSEVTKPPYEGEIEFGSGPFPSNVRKVLTDVLGEPGDYRKAFDPISKAERTGVARFDRMAAGFGDRIRKLVPDPKERAQITLARVRGDTSSLTPAQRQVGDMLEQTYKAMAGYALENEAITGVRQRYSPQLWDVNDPQTARILNEWRLAQGKGMIEPGGFLAMLAESRGMGTVARSPFTMKRVITDLFEGMKLGLKPASLDPAALLETYISSMARTVERGKTMKALVNLRADDNLPMVMEQGKGAPQNYVKINAPELEGMRVHPDIAPAVRVMMETEDPGLFNRAWSLVNYTGKRALTMYSGFHMGSLYAAWVGSGGNPFRPGQGVTTALKAYRDGGVGDTIDKLLAGGLQVSAPLEDVLGRSKILNVYKRVEGKVDEYVPGKPMGKARAVDEWLQKATFEQVMTGFKLDLGMKFYEQEAMKNLGRAKPLTEDQIAKQVAERVNNVFGSQDWAGKLENYESPVMRDVMSRLYSPKGRGRMQRMLFAPDWLNSTMGSWTDALAGLDNKLKVDPVQGKEIRSLLAAKYIARSLTYQQVIGNAMQYQMTGTLMVDNEPDDGSTDLTKRFLAKNEVRLPNGQRMDLSKHFMEPVHALADPGQFAVGKLGVVPREAMAQIENKKWPVPPTRMSDLYPPNITDPGDSFMESLGARGAHAAQSFIPIPLQNIDKPGTAIAGMFGASARGTPDSEKMGRAERKIKERELKRQKRENR